jgi:asparaginyl-tRNA synthetase
MIFIKRSNLNKLKIIYNKNKRSYSKLPNVLSNLLPTRTINNIITSSPVGAEIQVNGWIRTVRIQKNVSFASINDGTSVKGLQAILSNEVAKKLDRINFILFFFLKKIFFQHFYIYYLD